LFPWTRTRRADQVRKATTFALAVILPIAASALTHRFRVLQTVPFSLYFISITVVSSLDGIVPALLAVAVSLLSKNYFFLPGHRLFFMSRYDLIRVVILIIAAGVISLIAGRRRKASDELEAAMALLRDRSSALIQSLHGARCAAWLLDLESGQSTRWYEGSYEVFGRPYAEMEAMPSLGPLLHPDDQPRLKGLREMMLTTNEPLVFEHRVVWPNGELHYLEMRGTRVDGPGCVWRGVTVDVTERKLAEAALLRSEKLAAMGRLASTVAHEINNPLESVTNLLYLIRADETMSAAAKEYLVTAESELARLSEITRLTLGFVRTGAARRPLVAEDVIETVLAIFRQRFAARGITLERDFEPGVQVLMAPHELRQIATNLLSNAADAMAGADCRIRLRIAIEEGSAVLIVEDTGHGIAEDDLPRIFEPFFTTKHDVGTGIGLWVTKELAESNGGRVWAESGALEDGMRTRFRVELPLAGEGVAEALSGQLRVTLG
jgi:signal transduction histidine kinase